MGNGIFDDTAVQWIFAILLNEYFGYNTTKRNWVKFHDHYKNIDLSGHSKSMIVVSIVLAAAMFILSILSGGVVKVPAGSLFYYRMAFIALGIIFIGQAYMYAEESGLQRMVCGMPMCFIAID